jgi:hypothetical protein
VACDFNSVSDRQRVSFCRNSTCTANQRGAAGVEAES